MKQKENKLIINVLNKLEDKIDNYFEAFDVYCDYYEDEDDKESVRVNNALSKLVFRAIKEIKEELQNGK